MGNSCGCVNVIGILEDVSFVKSNQYIYYTRNIDIHNELLLCFRVV